MELKEKRNKEKEGGKRGFRGNPFNGIERA